MSFSDRVRTSRDGDQFHYLWAARRCLRLLDPASDLIAVTVEGVSKRENPSALLASAGEEVVDVAEYYGSEDFAFARQIIYRQLKHSTVRTDKPWTASELTNTLRGFGELHRGHTKSNAVDLVERKVRYELVTNRPVGPRVLQTALELATGSEPTFREVAEQFVKAVNLPTAMVAGFFSLLSFSDAEAKFTDQDDLLNLESAQFLVGEDLDAANRLYRYVADKATTKGQANPSIRLGDLLLTLRVGPDQIYPAPSKLVADPQAVPRQQEVEIARAVAAALVPVLVLAPGGVGKSVLATRLPGLMPAGSHSVTFDCFANGQYREPAKLRHSHKRGLVQIANELAGAGLCLPLLPTTGADAQDYLRGFLDRTRRAAEALRARSPNALLVLIVDAADNCQMAADEAGGPPAFVRDLLRSELPEGVRLVMLLRPERRDLLNPPPGVVDLCLRPFERSETAAHLRRTYPDASEAQVDEFHRLSAHNPRVQANALAAEPDLAALLRSLGPDPTSVNAVIGDQLARAIAKLRDEAGGGAVDIDVLCVALAALRPLIPLRVLSAVSGLAVGALHSFASDFGGGRWLLVSGEAIQFRDEPVEDWFRQTFVASPEQLSRFIERLKPLSDEISYVAATLPALMLECGQLTELVELALSASRLPANSPLDRREIELERLRFALRASLASERWLDAAKLSTKAAEEVAGQARHEALLEANTDLVGALLEAGRLQEIAARRTFRGGWLGARYAREAALMSAAPELRGDALNRFSIAYDLLRGWSRLPDDERAQQKISHDDRAELMLAALNLHGAERAVSDLVIWRPNTLWFEAALILARRLVDVGRFAELDEVALVAASKKAGPVIAAVALALSEVSRTPPNGAVTAALALSRLLPRERDTMSDWNGDVGLDATVALVEAAIIGGAADRPRLAKILSRRLPKTPPFGLGNDYNRARPGYTRAVALLAALRGRNISLIDLADGRMKAALKAGHHETSHSERVGEFRTRVGASLPWWALRARFILHGNDLDLDAEIEAALRASQQAYSNSMREWSVQDEVSLPWFDLICRAPAPDRLLPAFDQWANDQKRPMYTTTWAAIARKSARKADLQAHAHRYARRATGDEWAHASETVDTRIEALVKIARALVSFDREEAELIFGQAIDIASRLGDEVSSRWESVLSLAEAAAKPDFPDPQLAYRLGRCAELTSEYVHKGFDWEKTVDGMVGLAPASAIAIVSRWRDRGLGRKAAHYVGLWKALQTRGIVDPRLGAAFLGLRLPWAVAEVLGPALNAANAAEKALILDMAARGARLNEIEVREWVAIIDVARRHDLATAELQRGMRAAQAADAATSSQRSHRRRSPRDRRWRKAMAAAAIRTFNDAAALREQLKGGLFDSEAFWSDVFARVPLEQTTAFIRDALAPGGVSIYDLQSFFAALPPAWCERLATQRAIEEGVEDLARRFGWTLAAKTFWSPFTLKLAQTWSGLSEARLTEAAIRGIADDIVGAGSADLFNLAGFLAFKLDEGEAREALAHSLDLIEVSLSEDVGDGAWRVELAPPETDLELAIAGLLWGLLGDVHRELRWEAAHVVRRLCRLSCHRIVAELLRLAAGQGAGPYASDTLVFYLHDARQWLMIALARAALDDPHVLGAHVEAILPFARRAHPHVVIRHHAASAVLALVNADVVSIDPALRKELAGVDGTHLPIRDVETYYEPPPAYTTPRTEETRFVFDYEMSKGMIDSLARVFATSLDEVQDIATRVIREDWGLAASGRWDGEPRRGQAAFRHGSRDQREPDRLSEHLSYHATMCAAGKLLETRNVRRYAGERRDDYAEWLGYRLLTRTDGRWISDRRDPPPPMAPLEVVPDDFWPWSVQREDFAKVIGLDAKHLAVWGQWTQYRERQKQRVEVRSALVEPTSAMSLLVSTQTAARFYDVLLPNAEDEPSAGPWPYVLEAFVSAQYREPNVDGEDPWAANIGYPPPVPAARVVRHLQLQPQDDQRRWTRPGRRDPLFSAEVWSSSQAPHEDSPTQRGERLTIARRGLLSTLKALGRELVVQVRIDREIRRSYGSGGSGDVIEYPQPYFMIFLLRQDGSVETLT